MSEPQSDSELERTKINLETSTIAWKELQRFFASGGAVYVASDLDLVDVAQRMAQDDVQTIKEWMAAGKVANVSDQQAQSWFESDALVWAVVVKPWVLVQDKSPSSG